MNRFFLATLTLTAFLIGCAASAVHVTAPMPALAASDLPHAGGSCYNASGIPCPSGYHTVHGTAYVHALSCPKGDACGPTTVTFSGDAKFSEDPACTGSASGMGASDATPVIEVLTPNSIRISGLFYRLRPGTTRLTVKFECSGA